MRKIYSLCALAAAMLAAPAANAFTIDEICGNYSINTKITQVFYVFGNGVNYTSTEGTMTIVKGDGNNVTIKNFINGKADITATFDESTGKLTIPHQTWFTYVYSGNWDLELCGGTMELVGGYESIPNPTDLTGTFDENKVLTVEGWNLLEPSYGDAYAYNGTSIFTPKEEGDNEGTGNGFALEEILGDYNTNITAVQAFDILTSYDESNSAWSQFSQPTGTMTIEKGDSDNAIILKGFVANHPDINATYNAETGTITIQATSNWPISNYTLCKEVTGYDSDGYFVITSREAFTGQFDADKKLTFAPWAVCNNSYSDVVVYQTSSVYTPANAAIEGITADDADINAPVEFYNLQGVRVNAENLGTGIYIRRQGSKATKIFVTK